jgi:acyl carrier protein
MNQNEVIARLQLVFDDVFLEPVKLSSSLTAEDVPEWDSLIHISLIVAVEEAFNVRFRVGEVEHTKNVGEFADLIARRMTSGATLGLRTDFASSM